VSLIDREGQRDNSYSMFGMVCGTVSFLGCIGAFVYLAMHNHETSAGVVLGTSVLMNVGLMIRGRR
jgi:hypothetical protein